MIEPVYSFSLHATWFSLRQSRSTILVGGTKSKSKGAFDWHMQPKPVSDFAHNSHSVA